MLTKRYIFASILLFSLVIPFCIIFLWYQGQLLSASEQARAFIKRDHEMKEWVWLKFSREEAEHLLKWEHDQEFAYRGEMYDIIESCFQGDSVVYLCYHDTHETKLKQELKVFVTNFLRQGQQDDNQRQHTKDFFKLICYSSIQTPCLPVIDIGCQICQEHYPVIISSFLSGPPTPPPRISC